MRRRAEADRAKGITHPYVPPKLTPAEQRKFERLRREGEQGNERERRAAARRKPMRERGSFLGLTTHPFVERFYGDLAHAAIDVPRGVLALSQAAQDDFLDGPKNKTGRPWGRSRAILTEARRQTWRDVRHPLRHPGNTALLLGSLLAGGVGYGIKGTAAAGAARRAAAATSRPRRVAAHKGRKAGARLRELDPANLGVKRMMKQLAHEEKGRRPLVAADRAWRANAMFRRAPAVDAADVGAFLARQEQAANALEERKRAVRRHRRRRG